MAPHQQVSPFIAPESVTAAAPAKGPPHAKAKREGKPLVSVPESIADEKLEPHWLPTIDAATD